MTFRHLAISAAAVTASAAALAACGGSKDSGTAQGAVTPQPRSSRPSPHPASRGQGIVGIANFAFTPKSLTVARGTKIVISNHDSTAHTATADDGQVFDTGAITPGKSATITLSKPGRYPYHCNIHPFMHGTVIVK